MLWSCNNIYSVTIFNPFDLKVKHLCHSSVFKVQHVDIYILVEGKASIEKNVFFRALPELWGGGLHMPEFFGPLFRSAFLVNKKSLFLQKCQCIELLTVF